MVSKKLRSCRPPWKTIAASFPAPVTTLLTRHHLRVQVRILNARHVACQGRAQWVCDSDKKQAKQTYLPRASCRAGVSAHFCGFKLQGAYVIVRIGHLTHRNSILSSQQLVICGRLRCVRVSVSRLRSRSCKKTCSAAHSTPPNAPGILGPSNSSFRLGAGRFSRTNLATTRLSTFAVTLSNRPISTGKLCAAQVRQQTGARASERTRGQSARQELLSRIRGQRRAAPRTGRRRFSGLVRAAWSPDPRRCGGSVRGQG